MKLSIITINYNNLEGLRKTIQSVLSQSFRDFEWIIVDGGSTDGSIDLLKQYQSNFTWWCSEKDNGVYNAMNKGIKHARGEYINFMNSGDVFAGRDTLSTVFNKDRKADILFGYMMCGSLNGVIGNGNIMKKNITKLDLFFDTFGHQSTYTRKSLFDKCGLFDESYTIAADHKFFANAIMNHNATTEFIPYKLSIYEGNGISGNYDVVYKDVLRLREEIYHDVLIEDQFNLLRELREIYSFKGTLHLYKFLVRICGWYRRIRYCKYKS